MDLIAMDMPKIYEGISCLEQELEIPHIPNAKVDAKTPLLLWVHPFYSYGTMNYTWFHPNRPLGNIAQSFLENDSYSQKCQESSLSGFARYQIRLEMTALAQAQTNFEGNICYVLGFDARHLVSAKLYLNEYSKSMLSVQMLRLQLNTAPRKSNMSFALSLFGCGLKMFSSSSNETYYESQIDFFKSRAQSDNEWTGTFADLCAASSAKNLKKYDVPSRFRQDGAIFSSSAETEMRRLMPGVDEPTLYCATVREFEKRGYELGSFTPTKIPMTYDMY